jgi:predicted ArsR family transcriptional regulator
MRKPRGNVGPTWPPIVFLLTKAPRTVSELTKFGGCHENTVRYVIRLLVAEGLVRMGKERPSTERGRQGRAPREWEWAA